MAKAGWVTSFNAGWIEVEPEGIDQQVHSRGIVRFQIDDRSAAGSFRFHEAPYGDLIRLEVNADRRFANDGVAELVVRFLSVQSDFAADLRREIVPDPFEARRSPICTR